MQLLSKVTIGGQELNNRLALAPLTRGRGTPNKDDPLSDSTTTPNDIMVEYYRQRATAGLVITEATAISEAGCGWLNAPHIRTPENVAGWKKVTEAVHEKGGVIYLQLWHMGRQSHSSFHPSTGQIFSASAVPVKGSEVHTASGGKVPYETPKAMTIEDIDATIQDYVRAGRLAKEAGFDGVEVHAANGYLLDQFLQSHTNKRSDKYGGSMENRFRFLKETVEALIEDGSFPANRIGFRLSPNGVFGDMGSEDNYKMFPFVAKEMSKYGLAYLHLMDGLGFGYHEKCKVVTAFEMKAEFKGPLICNIGLTKDTAEGMIRSGAADLCAFGRLYISNPDLPERFANGWPTAPEATYETWWQPTGAKGYTDFPFYEQQKELEEKTGE